MGNLYPNCICDGVKESKRSNIQVQNLTKAEEKKSEDHPPYLIQSLWAPNNPSCNVGTNTNPISVGTGRNNNSPPATNISANCEQILTEITKKKKQNVLSNNPGKIINKVQSKELKENSNAASLSCPAEESDMASPNQANWKKTWDNKNIDHKISKTEESNILKALSKHFWFQDTPPDVLSIMLNELIFFSYEQGKIIYEEGNDGNFFYIWSKGEIEAVSSKKNTRKVYKKWDCFGEWSLMSKCKREETLTCWTEVEFFSWDGESFREIQKRINETRLRDKYDFLNSISIFRPLGNIPKYNVALKLTAKEFIPNTKIISYGDIGDTLYIIKDGLVSCRIGCKEVRKLSNNDYFGQNAIIIDMKRSCDVIALNKTICYEVSRNDLKDALGPEYIDVILFSFFKNCIENASYFKDIFIDSKWMDLFKCFSIQLYGKDEKLISNKCKSNKRVVLIVDGSWYKEGYSTTKYELFAAKGSVVGEEIFKDISKELPNDIVAYPDCITFEAEIESLCKILNIVLNSTINPNIHDDGSVTNLNAANTKKDNGNNATNVEQEQAIPLNLLNRISKLKKTTIFRNLSEKTIEQIAKAMSKKRFNKDDIIVEEGTQGDTFYLITKGIVRVTVGKKWLRDWESGNCFGEVALLSSGEKRTATVKAIEEVICYVISKDEFDIIIVDKKIKEYMIKKLSLQDTSIGLNDLHLVKFWGKGKFGSVNWVHNKKNIYAIKAVSRRSVEKQKILAKYFVNERRVMLSWDHPFVIKMVKSWKNNFYCFFLMEFVNGMNLDEYLTSRPQIKNIPETQFYMASMLIMLDYWQPKYIAHRDIKPSNIMIDSTGYLKMIDFGTAKVLSDYTSTIIGTPHYIAPEILQGKGYSLSCDFWSVGICMFEMFYGIYPFGHYANEVIEIYKDILHRDYVIPSENPKYNQVNAFIKDLLQKTVNQRICNVHQLQQKAFFEGFEWDKLIDFQWKPPYIPQVSDWKNMLDIESPFEHYVNEDTTTVTRKEKNDIPPGYEKRWADEF